MTRVSVITPTIPGREHFLAECKISVVSQISIAEIEHIIERDDEGDGNSVTTNWAAAKATGEWLIPLADDDLLLPGCVASLLEASDDADVVYSPPLVNGNEDRWWFFQAPPAIPSFGLIRKDLWESCGGYDESAAHEEDRQLWIKMLDAGARFVRIDDPCWVYRQHPGNKSFNKEKVA